MTQRKSSEKLIWNIKRNTREKNTSEEKIRIVIEGMRGETSIVELCCRKVIFHIFIWKYFYQRQNI